jgi:hypothetical protein
LQKQKPRLLIYLTKIAEVHYVTADELFSVDTPRAAELHEAALMLDIAVKTTATPAFLAAVNVRTDLQRNQEGQIVSLSVGGCRTKNGGETSLALSPSLAERLERHIETFRPHLPAAKSERLFVSGSGTAETRRMITLKIQRLIRLAPV